MQHILMHCLLCKNMEAFIEGLWSNSRCYLKHFPCLLPFQLRLQNFILLQSLEVLLGQVFQMSPCTSMLQYDPITSLVHCFKCTIFDVRHRNMFLKFHISDRNPNVDAITCQNSWFVFTPWIYFFSEVNLEGCNP